MSTQHEAPTLHTGRIVLRGLFEHFSLAEYGEFVPLSPGVHILPLYGLDPQGRAPPGRHPSAAFLRYEPGAFVPHHRHRGYEHIFVIQGSQRDERGTYPRGTCVISPPGSRHRVHSDEGCLVLAIWNQPVEFQDAQA